MARDRLTYWIGAGMGATVVLFAAIVIFTRGEDYFALVLVVYSALLIVWAFVAELGLVRSERKWAEKERGLHSQPKTLVPH